MNLRQWVKRLGERVPAGRPAGVPTDQAVLLAGLLAGAVSFDDFDRPDADQVSALGVAAATLIAATEV